MPFKVPEQLFVIINPVMRFVLRSPLHRIFSSSLMLITFWGNVSGRKYTTPVRYIKDGDTVRCFTAAENRWWRNLRRGARVKLLIKGRRRYYQARAIVNDRAEVRRWLVRYLGLFPQDAVYHDIRLNPDKSLVEADLDRAVDNAIVVEANPL